MFQRKYYFVNVATLEPGCEWSGRSALGVLIARGELQGLHGRHHIRSSNQVRQILDYVSQIEGVEQSQLSGQEYPGPRQSLREDEPHQTPLSVPLDQLAPVFRDGLFLVPRVRGTGPPGAAAAGSEEE